MKSVCASCCRRLVVRVGLTLWITAISADVVTAQAAERGLTRISSGLHEEMEPQWSPDGSKLSYGSGRQGDQNVFVFDFDAGREIQVTKGLGFVHSTSWSPAGDRIAYVTTVDTERGINSHIYSVEPASGAIVQLTHGKSIDGSPSWSPDGTRIAFPSRRSGTFNLWIQGVGREDARMVTDHPETDHGPEWSPDGRLIAFHSDRGKSTSIWILDVEKGSLTQLTDDRGNDQYPDWSPDGRHIVFNSDRSGNHDIWVQAISGGKADQVTKAPGADIRPSWSPDGERIAFSSDRAGSMDIWIVDAPPETPTRAAVLELASRVADWQLARLDGLHITTHMKEESRDPRSWQQGAFWVGMTRLAHTSGEARYRDAILAQGRKNLWKPGDRVYHADDHVIAQSYLWAATHGAGKEVIAPIRGTFDAILADPPVVHLSFYFEKDYGEAQCLRRWCWCDAVFMSPPAWLELARQTREKKYRDYAMSEFWAATDFLYDPAEKLYFRDSRFFERRDEQGRKLFWSRGNGWVFAGIANMLDALPRDDPDRPRLEQLFREMAARLKSIQKPDGYWAPSLLGPENSPPETSGTGFFVYGLAWGMNRGLLDAGEYRSAIYRGWDALARAVNSEGRLGWVQQVSDRPEQVNESDTQFYGVGAFLLAASEVAVLRKD